MYWITAAFPHGPKSWTGVRGGTVSLARGPGPGKLPLAVHCLWTAIRTLPLRRRTDGLFAYTARAPG